MPAEETITNVVRANIWLAVAGVVCSIAGGWLATVLLGPDPPQLAAPASGDEALAADVETALGGRSDGLDALAVAVIDGGDVRHVGFGRQHDGAPVDADTRFEIGSVTKPLTGMVLADLVDEGTLDPGSTLADISQPAVAIDGSGGTATLEELASHRSGYPQLPRSSLLSVLASNLDNGDPYEGDADDVLQDAGSSDGTPGSFSYSNLGMAALGDAMAANQSTTFASLLSDRLLQPLAMDDTVVLEPGDSLPDARVDGMTSNGRGAEPWVATGWQPAGIGVWSSGDDMAKLATAVIDGSAPGLRATEGLFERSDDSQVGYGWLRGTTDDGVEIINHAGGTGGFRSWVGIDPSGDRAVVILSNTTTPISDLGSHLLARRTAPIDGQGFGVIDWFILGFTLLGTALPLIAAVRGLLSGAGDRQGLIRRVVSSVVGLAIVWAVGRWYVIPVWVWSIGASLTVATILVSIAAWPRLPFSDSDRPKLHLAGTVASLLFSLFLVALLW